jgi:hypothetical protein
MVQPICDLARREALRHELGDVLDVQMPTTTDADLRLEVSALRATSARSSRGVPVLPAAV